MDFTITHDTTDQFIEGLCTEEDLFQAYNNKVIIDFGFWSNDPEWKVYSDKFYYLWVIEFSEDAEQQSENWSRPVEKYLLATLEETKLKVQELMIKYKDQI